jgi:uncharacterized protein YbjQ (UPF0145 family)
MAAADIERIRDGGIPLGAEQRLTGIGAAAAPVFSSDLTAKEYLLTEGSQMTPLALVMGSSVVQHGWSNYGFAGFRGGIGEVPALAQPWNLSRERSFGRLRQEAEFAGADAVIGIELTAKAFLGEPGNVEYVVFGTAVRDNAAALAGRPKSGPRLCTLSGQEVDKLRRIGAETVDVIGHTSVVCVALSPRANQMMGMWWGNQEMGEVTEGVYVARHLAIDAVKRQAAAVGANEMVISTLQHTINHREYESVGFRQHYFIVAMHVLGTAIALDAHPPHPAPLGVPMMSINLGAN